MKLLLVQGVSKKTKDEIRDMGYEILDYKEEKITEENVKDVDVIYGFSPFRFVGIEKFENLSLVQLSSAGMNEIDLDELIAHDVMLANNRGTFSIPIGEFIVMRVLELLKKSRLLEQLQRDKEWKRPIPIDELTKKTVGFLGTGSIAQEAAKRLKPFDCDLVGFNRSGKADETLFEEVYPDGEYDKALGKCDFLIITVPYTDETYHQVDADFLASLKKGAHVINVARGEIIDDEALIRAIQDKHIAGAALDVFVDEPLPEDHPYWEMEEVMVSSHISFFSQEVFKRTDEMLAENLRRYKEGKPLINRINLEKGY